MAISRGLLKLLKKQYWPPMNADFGSAIQIGVHPRSSAAKLVLPFQREDDA
jgi:hypothetical protein